MKNSATKYIAPDYEIDDRLFFQDINLKNIETVNKYQELISQGKYTDASTLLETDMYNGDRYPETDYYGAWILNLLENRLLAIETYLQTKTKPKLVAYSPTDPLDGSQTKGFSWIS